MSTPAQPPGHGRLRPAHPDDAVDGRPTSGAQTLTELIVAAAAPPNAGALPGETTALAAFRAAHRDPAAQPGGKSMIQMMSAKLLTVKAAAIAGGLILTGGIAVAASSGVIPNPLPGGKPATSTPTGTPTPVLPAPGSPAAATIFGLCTAYLTENDAKLLDTPAYAPLVTAAGGTGNVTEYCTKAAANPPSTNPAQATPGHSTGAPTSRAATPTPSHPTGAPTPVPAPAHPSPIAVPTRPKR